MPLRPAALSPRPAEMSREVVKPSCGVDRQGRLPFPRRSMEHEAAIHLDRAAEVDGQAAACGVVQRDLDLLEQILERHVDRSIDDYAQRPWSLCSQM